jgi:hypothetical protein
LKADSKASARRMSVTHLPLDTVTSTGSGSVALGSTQFLDMHAAAAELPAEIARLEGEIAKLTAFLAQDGVFLREPEKARRGADRTPDPHARRGDRHLRD